MLYTYREHTIAATYFDMTVKEMTRADCEGGVVMSITAACADAVREYFQIAIGKLYEMANFTFQATVSLRIMSTLLSLLGNEALNKILIINRKHVGSGELNQFRCKHAMPISDGILNDARVASE